MSDARPWPELILSGGRLWSSGGVPRGADSVAVAGGRIVAVGPAVDVARLARGSTRTIDLGGRLLLPGFGDSHSHPIMGGLDRLRCDLSDVAERAEAYVQAIAAYAAGTDRPWIMGSGWSMAAFPDGRPDRRSLDPVLPDRPVLIHSRDGHSAWANSAALRLAGIDARTPDPPNGRIERDLHGEPQGTLQEAAVELVARLSPPATAQEHEEALIIGQAYLHGLGITSWNEAIVDAETQAAYLALEARGVLTGRASLSLLWDEDRGLEQIAELRDRREAIRALGSPRLRAESVKIFQDGVIESRTAALLEPYLDGAGRPSQEMGMSTHPPKLLMESVSALDREGFAVHAHAIGDRAVREVLDAVAAAIDANGRRDARHNIAHIQLIDPLDIARFAALGVVANAQPLWAAEDSYLRDLTRPIVGDARTDRMYPFRSLATAGARLAIGSDWNVSTADPLALLEVAVRRVTPQRPDDPPFGPAERLSLEAALEAFTAGSAFVNGFDHDAGVVETGRAADLVVIEGDLLSGSVRPTETAVVLTIAGGRIVHEVVFGA
ncbi:MAG: amidohydrolase [Chloroflexota bacterium]|nr:amidohydrolase [Chloroflexota bacterium]